MGRVVRKNTGKRSKKSNESSVTDQLVDNAAKIVTIPVLDRFQYSTCYICGGIQDEEMIILCDRVGCYNESHMYCLNPVLTEVPDGEWFCSSCDKLGTTKNLQEYFDYFDKLYQQYSLGFKLDHKSFLTILQSQVIPFEDFISNPKRALVQSDFDVSCPSLIGNLVRFTLMEVDQIHVGRIIHRRFIEGPKRWEHLIQFKSGADGRNQGLLRWVNLEEHRCTVADDVQWVRMPQFPTWPAVRLRPSGVEMSDPDSPYSDRRLMQFFFFGDDSIGALPVKEVESNVVPFNMKQRDSKSGMGKRLNISYALALIEQEEKASAVRAFHLFSQQHTEHTGSLVDGFNTRDLKSLVDYLTLSDFGALDRNVLIPAGGIEAVLETYKKLFRNVHDHEIQGIQQLLSPPGEELKPSDQTEETAEMEKKEMNVEKVESETVHNTTSTSAVDEEDDLDDPYFPTRQKPDDTKDDIDITIEGEVKNQQPEYEKDRSSQLLNYLETVGKTVKLLCLDVPYLVLEAGMDPSKLTHLPSEKEENSESKENEIQKVLFLPGEKLFGTNGKDPDTSTKSKAGMKRKRAEVDSDTKHSPEQSSSFPRLKPITSLRCIISESYRRDVELEEEAWQAQKEQERLRRRQRKEERERERKAKERSASPTIPTTSEPTYFTDAEGEEMGSEDEDLEGLMPRRSVRIQSIAEAQIHAAKFNPSRSYASKEGFMVSPGDTARKNGEQSDHVNLDGAPPTAPHMDQEDLDGQGEEQQGQLLSDLDRGSWAGTVVMYLPTGEVGRVFVVSSGWVVVRTLNGVLNSRSYQLEVVNSSSELYNSFEEAEIWLDDVDQTQNVERGEATTTEGVNTDAQLDSTFADAFKEDGLGDPVDDLDLYADGFLDPEEDFSITGDTMGPTVGAATEDMVSKEGGDRAGKGSKSNKPVKVKFLDSIPVTSLSQPIRKKLKKQIVTQQSSGVMLAMIKNRQQIRPANSSRPSTSSLQRAPPRSSGPPIPKNRTPASNVDTIQTFPTLTNTNAESDEQPPIEDVCAVERESPIPMRRRLGPFVPASIHTATRQERDEMQRAAESRHQKAMQDYSRERQQQMRGSPGRGMWSRGGGRGRGNWGRGGIVHTSNKDLDVNEDLRVKKLECVGENMNGGNRFENSSNKRERTLSRDPSILRTEEVHVLAKDMNKDQKVPSDKRQTKINMNPFARKTADIDESNRTPYEPINQANHTISSATNVIRFGIYGEPILEARRATIDSERPFSGLNTESIMSAQPLTSNQFNKLDRSLSSRQTNLITLPSRVDGGTGEQRKKVVPMDPRLRAKRPQQEPQPIISVEKSAPTDEKSAPIVKISLPAVPQSDKKKPIVAPAPPVLSKNQRRRLRKAERQRKQLEQAGGHNDPGDGFHKVQEVSVVNSEEPTPTIPSASPVEGPAVPPAESLLGLEDGEIEEEAQGEEEVQTAIVVGGKKHKKTNKRVRLKMQDKALKYKPSDSLGPSAKETVDFYQPPPGLDLPVFTHCPGDRPSVLFNPPDISQPQFLNPVESAPVISIPPNPVFEYVGQTQDSHMLGTNLMDQSGECSFNPVLHPFVNIDEEFTNNEYNDFIGSDSNAPHSQETNSPNPGRTKPKAWPKPKIDRTYPQFNHRKREAEAVAYMEQVLPQSLDNAFKLLRNPRCNQPLGLLPLENNSQSQTAERVDHFNQGMGSYGNKGIFKEQFEQAPVDSYPRQQQQQHFNPSFERPKLSRVRDSSNKFHTSRPSFHSSPPPRSRPFPPRQSQDRPEMIRAQSSSAGFVPPPALSIPSRDRGPPTLNVPHSGDHRNSRKRKFN